MTIALVSAGPVQHFITTNVNDSSSFVTNAYKSYARASERRLCSSRYAEHTTDCSTYLTYYPSFPRLYDEDDGDVGRAYGTSTFASWHYNTAAKSGNRDVEKQQTGHWSGNVQRSFLIETAFADADGNVVLHRKLPDTATTWFIQAFSLSNTSGLAASKLVKLKASSQFFVAANLPFGIICNEILTVKVIVFNYMSQQQNVTVTLKLCHPDNTTETDIRTVFCTPNQPSATVFAVLSEQTGDLSLEVTAECELALHRTEKVLPVKSEFIYPSKTNDIPGSQSSDDASMSQHRLRRLMLMFPAALFLLKKPA
ncbi:complement C3-like [Paramacrobiotus metropolitanus]|uniref:complement C3-like n=1 Tax=Paramacrobiotus metropolitanus TaxID=2943436 RepID=UPI0024456606|nr:complement C3-like [Paramacrobiotus metropolitanus]